MNEKNVKISAFDTGKSPEILKAIRRQNRSKVLSVIVKILVYLMLTFWALMVLFPFYYMILTSFKGTEYGLEPFPNLLYTLRPTLENYQKAFSANLSGYIGNTLIFTVATTVIMLVVSILAAYAFARLNFPGKKLLFILLLSLMMIPSELMVITNYATVLNVNREMADLGWYNQFEGMITFAELILPSVASVFYIYLLKENFSQIPDELYLAAKVDGTTDLKYLIKVIIPMCKPTIVTVTILKVIECWNSFVWPRLVAQKSAYYLVSNGIQEIREHGFGRDNIPGMMAAVVVVSVPLIVLFLTFKNKIMAGVSRGGLKG